MWTVDEREERLAWKRATLRWDEGQADTLAELLFVKELAEILRPEEAAHAPRALLHVHLPDGDPLETTATSWATNLVRHGVGPREALGATGYAGIER